MIIFINPLEIITWEEKKKTNRTNCNTRKMQVVQSYIFIYIKKYKCRCVLLVVPITGATQD